MISFKVFTLFPEVIQAYLAHNAPLKRGIERQIIQIESVNYRDYSQNRHHKVDDEVYGGGPGMLISPQPLLDAVQAFKTPSAKILIMDPRGKVLDNQYAKELAGEKEIFLICGRYEGFDQRIIDSLEAQMVSLGDFVLTGGELAALAVIDSTCRFVKGSLDDFASQENESFNHGLLEHDQYTRPAVYENKAVPDELQSGNHKKIEAWKYKNSLKNTLLYRPDLLKKMIFQENPNPYFHQIILEKYFFQ